MRAADITVMDVYARPDLHSQAPPTAGQERDAPIFSGTPEEVARFLGPRMSQRTHTLALLAAELKHLARSAWQTDSLTFVLADETSVTVWP
ncbi:MAG TPA: hypothetical protein VHF51_04570 [Solirubrobacteraceae bacterium]|nr:hypothetical protein [Solirubrobacteraceae bacterium]